MKLVIDIPEEYYKAIKSISDKTSTMDMLLIKNGTLFDSVIEDIKTEITSMTITSTNAENLTRTMAELYSFKRTVLSIIDKCTSGKEQE